MRGKIHRTTNLAGEMVCPECFLGVEELESPEERFSLLVSGYCIDCVPDDVADELSESRCVYRGEIIPMDPYESYWVHGSALPATMFRYQRQFTS
jgi:hypothetical protein